MSRKRNTFWVRFLTSHQHLSVNDMLRRSIHQPVASLHEKDVNNLRCNRRFGSPLCPSAPKELDTNSKHF